MRKRDAFALDDVDPRGRDVQQGIDQVIRQQIHLIDIENAAVRRRQQARLEAIGAVLQGGLDVDSAEHTVFRRTHR